MDMWYALHQLVADCEEGTEPPHILIHEDNPYYVTLLYEDGSQGTWRYLSNEKRWHACEALSTCPCDVAARDVL